MKTTFSLLATLALPLFSLVPANAAVNPAIVAADARWLAYADLNALRESAIGKELITLGEKAQIDTGAGKVGIDWQKLLATIGSATAYGANISPDPKQMDGALVVQGTADLRKIAESILLQANLANPKDVAELTDLPFPAYALQSMKADKTTQMEVIIAFPPEPIVLVSKSKAQILKARDVFRGTAPSLAKTPASPLRKFVEGSEGAYLFSATTAPAEKFFPEDGPQGRILKMANAGSLAIGDRGKNTFAHAELLASSDQMAEKLMKILQGMAAMMSLAESTDKQLTEFLNSAVVDRAGQVVTLDLAYESTRLVAMLQAAQRVQIPGDRRGGPAPVQIMTSGKVVAEWKAEQIAAPAAGPAPLAWRTIENVELKNGSVISLGRQTNGGRNVRYDQVEIIPAQGGTPLVFRMEFMRTAGPRGNMSQFPFPGADGLYTIKAAYLNDPDGKASYAVSVKEPAPRPAPAAVESKAK